jgi:Fe-S cluster biogenesis protein NfuA
MSLTVTEVAGNPNPKAVTFEIDADVLGLFDKIVFTKGGTTQQYSPLARAIFTANNDGRGGDTASIDLFHREGKTYVTLNRKLMDWTPESRTAAKDFIARFVNGREAAVHVQALAENVTALPKFTPPTPFHSWLAEEFSKSVTPALAKDGGAMELLDIAVREDTMAVSFDVAMIGSCTSCISGKTKTVSDALEVMSLLIEGQKLKGTLPPSMHVTDIHVRDVQDVVLKR